jgi:stage II sporulation protein D
LACSLALLAVAAPDSAHGQVQPGAGTLPSEIRVALSQGREAVTVGATATYQVTEVATGRVAHHGPTGAGVTISVSLGALYLGDAGPYAAPLAVRLAPGFAGRMAVLGRQYRGWLEILVGSDGRLLVVNQVPLEEYLLGVVPREMPGSWPMEALRAQAVAARTYAVSQILASQAAGAPFAVLATSESQVYGGSTGEAPNPTLAVDSTRGIVLTHQGTPISAVYHASSGGHTENSEIVWTSARAYLKGVPDFDQACPRFTWERTMTPAEVSSILTAAGHNIGRLRDIVPSGARGVSGRTWSITFRGDRGDVTLRSEEARRLLGLFSSLFEVTFAREGETFITTPMKSGAVVVVAGGSAGATVTDVSVVGASYSIGPEGKLHRMTRYSVVHRGFAAGEIRFAGRGWGHGVGMSQYGAAQLASDGRAYGEILAYYYRGAVLEQR